MPNYGPSLAQRKQALLDALKEECTMCVGSGGFEGASPAQGPTAGFDPLLAKALKKTKKKKTLDKPPAS
jgi:hypothetical protein